MRKTPRQPEPRIVDPVTHRPRWVNFTVAAVFLFGKTDRRPVIAYVEDGKLAAEYKGRLRKIHVDELVRFKLWLRRNTQLGAAS